MTRLDEGQVSGRQEQDGADDVGCPDHEVFLKPRERWNHGVERIEVEQNRADELEGATQPTDVVGSPAKEHSSLCPLRALTGEFARVGCLNQLQVRGNRERDRAREKDRIDCS